MTTPTATRRRQAATVLGLGALVASMLGGTAAMADVSPSNIDRDAKGSISIHKLETPEGGAAGENNSGEALDPGPGTDPVEGVTFKVERVDAYNNETIDLTTFAGWEAIDGITPSDAAEYGVLVDAQSDTTNSDGLAFFDGLDLGLYLVTETDKPDHVTSTVAPFLLTIPTPTDSGSVWNYDIHTYPKNSTTSINKIVEDNDHKAVGDEIVWTITGEVPILSEGQTHSRFELVDNLPDAVTYTSSVVEFDGDAAAAGDYEVAVDADGNPTMTLTATGLTAIESVKEVTWKVSTKVVALAEDGVLSNDASLISNDSDPITDSAEQPWGGIALTKLAADCVEPMPMQAGGEANTCLLHGAEFQIFSSQEAAEIQEGPITVDGEDTFVTGENGVVTIAGLQTGIYYLVETKAPAGYVLNTNVIEVEVTAGGEDSLLVVEVENEQKPQLELPPLGAGGMAAAIAAGAILIAAGGAIMIRNRRNAGEAA